MVSVSLNLKEVSDARAGKVRFRVGRGVWMVGTTSSRGRNMGRAPSRTLSLEEAQAAYMGGGAGDSTEIQQGLVGSVLVA